MTSWYLALVKIFWLRTLATTDWYNWQLVYSHDVIDSNQSFQSSSHFVVNKGCFVEQVIEKKIKINNLFIDIKIWSTSIKLLGNSTLKKTTLSKIWWNIVFLCSWDVFLQTFGPLRYHCQYGNIFFGYYSILNSLLINSSQLHYN